MDDDEPYPQLMGNKSGHALKLQQHLYDQLLAQSEFCDVTLVIGHIEMKAHWSVLVSCPYFQSLYDSGMKERQSDKVTISIGKTIAVRSAITFLYSGVLEISYDNVRDILEVADYLQIDDLKMACATYLASVTINIQNCINLSLLSSLYDLDIYNKVFDYVRGHLPEVMQQTETLSLTPESVMELLRDKSLNYVPMGDFFHFIVKWVRHDSEARGKYFEKMFCELDLKQMSSEFLETNVEVCSLVTDSDPCKLHVLNIKMKHLTGLLPDEPTSDVVLLVGGCGVGQYFHPFFSAPYFPLSDVISVNHVYGYIVNEDRWTELAPLPYTMRKPLVTYSKSTNCLYVYDASTAAQIDNDVVYIFKFNILEKSWTNMRVTLPAVCNEITIQFIFYCHNKLYIVASGQFFNEAKNHPESHVCLFWVSDDGQTELMQQLFPRSSRTQISACVVDDKYLCILGHKCGSYGSSRSKVVRFMYLNTHTMQMSECSKGVSYEPIMLPVENVLYLTKPGSNRHRRFNFCANRWSLVKEMLLPYPTEEPARTDYVYTMYNNELLVFGGKSPTSKKLIENACSYNIEKQSWTNLAVIPKAVTNCGVVVAKIPKEHVRCHIDCPHCVFYSVRSQAIYQIDYPDDEDEEDEDISYEDDEMYSDYWDDDLYDNMPDFDWY